MHTNNEGTRAWAWACGMWVAVMVGGCADAVVADTDDEIGEEGSGSSSTGAETQTETESGRTGPEETEESGTDESGTDESGTDESDTDESETEESDTDESDTDEPDTDGDPCDVAHDHSFEGSAASPGCGDFVFSGQVTGNPEPGVWELDTCPCDEECLVPDPQTFVIDLSYEDWQPELPSCLEIHIGRKMIEPPPIPSMCVIEDVDIYDDQGALIIAAHRNYPFWSQAFVGVGYEVTRETLNLGAACDWWEASELTFSTDDESLTLREAEVGVLTLGGVDYQVYVPMAHDSPPNQVNDHGEFDRESWMLVRQ